MYMHVVPLTRLNDKEFQGMSPQHFEWLKHSQGMITQQLNDKAFQGISPQQLNDKHPRAWALNNIWVCNGLKTVYICIQLYNNNDNY